MTPRSTATPYCSAGQLLSYHDWQQVADMVRDGGGTRPARADLLDASTSAGQIVANHLLTASGELEAACGVGKRYSPTDLSGLTGAGLAFLQNLVAHLAFWRLQQRRQPVSADPKIVPGAMQSLEMLAMLRDGERVFPTEEAEDAGLPEGIDTTVNNTTNRQNSLIGRASRLFAERC